MALLDRLLSVSEWNVGIADMRLEDLAVSDESSGPRTFRPAVLWLHKPWRTRFQADPCLVESEGRLYLCYEDVSYGSEKGRLRRCELSADGTVSDRQVMIDLSCHAAYPFVFEHQGSFFCVPETGTRERVVLYEASSPLGPWQERATLLDGVRARDSTLFRSGGRWWLFCTLADADPRSQYADLYIWHAADLLGPWIPHRLQPARSDIHSARPAGRLFVVGGMLCRPTQDCWPTYGLRVAVNRVVALTPDDFAEEVCAYIEADPEGTYPDGLHTVSGSDGLVVVDGYRDRPSLNPLKVGTEIFVAICRRMRGNGHT